MIKWCIDVRMQMLERCTDGLIEEEECYFRIIDDADDLMQG